MNLVPQAERQPQVLKLKGSSNVAAESAECAGDPEVRREESRAMCGKAKCAFVLATSRTIWRKDGLHGVFA